MPARKSGGGEAQKLGARFMSEQVRKTEAKPVAEKTRAVPTDERVDLYIIHGWTYTVEPWATTLSLLDKAGVKVKMLHVPGLTSPSRKVYTIDDYAKWADSEIPDGAVALGHSNGGRVLLNLCAKKPDKLSRLVLLDSAGVYEMTFKKRLVKALAKVGRPMKRVPLVGKVFHRLTGTTDYARAPENMKRTLENMLSSDKDLDLSRVTTPTTILWGEKDTITPPRQANKMQALLPNARLKFYKDWTHAPYIVDPEGLARAILQVLAKEGGR